MQLAEVAFTVSAAFRVENGIPGVTIDESARPLLLSHRHAPAMAAGRRTVST